MDAATDMSMRLAQAEDERDACIERCEGLQTVQLRMVEDLARVQGWARRWKRSAKMWRRIAANLTPWDIMSLWKSESPFHDDGKWLKHRGGDDD